MKIVNIPQGSPEWHEHRAKYDNASEAPAALNDSPYVKRNELIHAKKTGDVKQFSDFVQRYILDKGHRFEALARPLAEEIMGDDLSPLVGVKGKFSASFDGLTFCRKRAFEHKSMNKAIRDAFCIEDLPIYYREQMEHQLMVCDGESILFMATRWEEIGEDDNEEGATYGYAENERGIMARYKLVEEKHFDYFPDMELRARIVAGWEQLAKDVAAYEPPIIESAPERAVIPDLPAVVVTGSTFPDKATRENYTKLAKAMLAPTSQVPTNQKEAGDLLCITEKSTENEQTFKTLIKQTDVSEADKDAFRKWLGEMEKLFSRGRIDGTKNTEAFKQNEKTAMANKAGEALSEYIAELNAALTKPFMPDIPVDFWTAIKGKSNPKNMQNDVDAMLAKKKIEADRLAGAIRVNLDTFAELAGDFSALFDDDLSAICQKDADSFRALVKMRIMEHREAEERKQEEARQAAEANRLSEEQVAAAPACAAPGEIVDKEAGEIPPSSVVIAGNDQSAPAKPAAVSSLSPAYRKPSARDTLLKSVMTLTEDEAEQTQHFVDRLVERRPAAA